MSDSPRTFTEKEHEAIVADAVQREVAAATASKDEEIQSLQARIDALEAEKASLETEKADAIRELEDFKSSQEREREIAERKDERVAAVKRISARDLPEEYFTEERVTRWAEMADEAFDALLDDLAATSVAALTPEEASQLEGYEGKARLGKLADLLDARREAASERGLAAVKESAAFTGGANPTADDGKKSATRRFFSVVGG